MSTVCVNQEIGWLVQEKVFYSLVGEMEWKKGGAESIKEIAGTQ
jgi:hypothetical protein